MMKTSQKNFERGLFKIRVFFDGLVSITEDCSETEQVVDDRPISEEM